MGRSIDDFGIGELVRIPFDRCNRLSYRGSRDKRDLGRSRIIACYEAIIGSILVVGRDIAVTVFGLDKEVIGGCGSESGHIQGMGRCRIRWGKNRTRK